MFRAEIIRRLTVLLSAVLLLGPVFVVRILLHVKQPQSFGLVNKRLTLLFGELLPTLSQTFRDLGVVDVRLDLDDLPALNL